MKKYTLLNNIIFAMNILIIASLLFSFFLPNLSPEKFGLISLLSLIVPILIFGNILFLIYWVLVGFKKRAIPTLLILILSFFYIPSLYKWNDATKPQESEFSIMSYNVRHFNKYNWLKIYNIQDKISQFVTEEKPDIIGFQEYRHLEDFKLNYPYFSHPLLGSHKDPVKRSTIKPSLAIFSKFPIINDGVVKYRKYTASTIFADIVKDKDTIRVYNYHFRSLRVIPDEQFFGHDNSEELVQTLRESFKTQQKQINALNEHVKNCPYKVVLVGDMNNTAYSWIYKNTKNDFKDTFLEVGSGFGRTYNFKNFPLRIDYIFVDKAMKVNSHQNYNVKYSDHFPVMATVSF